MPFLFRLFQGKIEQVLGDEIEKWLEKARAGEIELARAPGRLSLR